MTGVQTCALPICQEFLKDIYSEGALQFGRDVKSAVDPDNLFGAANHGVLGIVQLQHEGKKTNGANGHG